MEDKRILRKRLQQQLSELPRPEYEHYSYEIAQRLFSEESWKQAETIGVTISKVPEVDTFQIIRKAWQENKRIVIPKCYPEDKKMRFRTLTAFNQLESVFYGLLEPIVRQTKEVPKQNIDLLIVPGLAFTRNGYRLGFGGGYYDRFLQDYHGDTLSLAFNLQLVSELPIEKHDIPVKNIINTEETIHIYE
jgi:5-formyltetrahydrofolate cyclo-ligase